jgi:HAD superfamily hydrolase (TIGR01509 family)
MEPVLPKADIRCFIFDLDGTLVFNESANFLAYEAAFKAVGHSLGEEDFMPHFRNGGSIEDIYAGYVTKHDLPRDESILGRIKEVKAKEYATRFHLIEQNTAVISLLRALAPYYPTALATTSQRVNGAALLENFNLLKLFDYTIFGEDVTAKKPNPECHQKIAKHFDVRPDQCLIFEDSPKGFAAAEAFGGHICKVVR